MLRCTPVWWGELSLSLVTGKNTQSLKASVINLLSAHFSSGAPQFAWFSIVFFLALVRFSFNFSSVMLFTCVSRNTCSLAVLFFPANWIQLPQSFTFVNRHTSLWHSCSLLLQHLCSSCLAQARNNFIFTSGNSVNNNHFHFHKWKLSQ